MNLLGLLMNGMAASESVQAVAKQSGADKQKSEMLIKLALPLLMKQLSGNASTQSGALSLLNALSQHTSQASIAEQIGGADMKDGEAIIGHILGGDSAKVIGQLAGQSGMTEKQVQSALSSMAPALLSSLSAANKAQNKKQDAGALIDLLGAAQGLGKLDQGKNEGNAAEILGVLSSILK